MDEDRRRGWPDEDRPDDAATGPTLGKDEDFPAPVDVRDTYGNAAPTAGDATASTTLDVEMPPAGPYPLPDVRERPAQAIPPGGVRQPTVDPSLSRAVDRAAAGLAPEAQGYDRTAEGPPPGPLDPPAEAQDANAEGEPAGQWGSSGSTP